MPSIPNTDFLFGTGSPPQNEGQLAAPETFAKKEDQRRPPPPDGEGRDDKNKPPKE